MKLVIVTGMSGSGKATALKIFEDLGYYCADNLPIPLVEKFAELISGNGSSITHAALGIDVRSGEEFEDFETIIDRLRSSDISLEILFMDARDEILIKRYKESRRSHPLAPQGRIESGISLERERLAPIKRKSEYIIDTSNLLTRELRTELERIFLKEEEYKNLFVTVLSFGFKYGIPSDADLVFDVRFLPNPYYVDDLKRKTGNQKEVQDYVKQGGTAEVFMEKLSDMIKFLIPNYIGEGKNQLVIAIGCTGGKHRSVTVANMLHEELKSVEAIGLKLEHRDIEKDGKK